MKTHLFLFFIFSLVWGLMPNIVGAEENAKTRVAVLYFENNSRRPELVPLAKGLCNIMIDDMAENAHIAVVERTRLEEIRNEINLSNSTIFDQGTTAKIGKLLGAEYLVLGSFFELGSKFRIDARMVHVETGRICSTAGVMGKADNFDEVEHQVVEKLLRNFPMTSAEVMRKPLQDKAKVSVATVAKYGEALEKIDGGDKKDAKRILSEVVKDNPSFMLAATTLREISGD